MSDRERLAEVMARAHADCKTTSAWAGNRWEKLGDRRVAARNARMSAAIAAAERAGFEFRKKEEEL